MPTYEYVCDACGERFEQFQSITAGPIARCPNCRKRKVRRLIGAGAGIIFKGSGFYQTDYRSESYKKSAEKDKSAGSPPEKSSEGKKSEEPSAKKDAAG
jgi:putative FmdB family regulatory protein